MYPSRESLIGILCIVGLVAAAHWYARNSDNSFGNGSPFQAGAPSRARAPRISVRTINWSADGRKLLASIRDSDGNESVVLHNVPPWDDRFPIDLTQHATTTLALAPDGRHVLVGTHKGKLRWIDVDLRDSTSLLELLAPFTASTIAADGQSVAAAAGAGRIFVCDISSETNFELETDYRIWISGLRFSCDGRLLVTCYGDGAVAVWDVASRERRLSLKGHEKAATGATFLPDSRRVVSVGHDDRICLWDIASGREEWRKKCGLNRINALAVSPDGKTAACGGSRNRIVVWDLELRQQEFEFMTGTEFVKDLQFSYDGKTLAAAGMENTVRFYDMGSGAEQPGLEVLPSSFNRRVDRE